MAIRNIVQVGDEVLRKKSAPVTAFDEKLHELLDDMKETLKAANGAGLAAVQVGILRRAFIVDVAEGYFEFINPVFVKTKGRQVGEEGCLSVRGKYGTVERPRGFGGQQEACGVQKGLHGQTSSKRARLAQRPTAGLGMK